MEDMLQAFTLQEVIATMTHQLLEDEAVVDIAVERRGDKLLVHLLYTSTTTPADPETLVTRVRNTIVTAVENKQRELGVDSGITTLTIMASYVPKVWKDLFQTGLRYFETPE